MMLRTTSQQQKMGYYALCSELGALGKVLDDDGRKKESLFISN